MPTEEPSLSTEANGSVFTSPNPVSTTISGDTTKLKSDEDSLFQIIHAQTQLLQVKESLGTIIDTLAENPSIITRATNYYGEMSSWQKITLGACLSLPTLGLGIFMQMGALLTISGATAVGYTASGIILDDNHRCSLSIKERLKTGIFSMADVLQFTIEALENIRQKLAVEIQKFKEENLKLAENVTNLGGQVRQLDAQVNLFKKTEKMLKESKNALQITVDKIKQSSNQQNELLEKQQKELEKVTNEYKASQLQLAGKVVELNIVKVSMECEVDKAKKAAQVLNGAVSTLSSVVIADTAQRANFHKKLESFLNDKDASFDKVADRISNAERELDTAKEEIKNVKNQLARSVEAQTALVNLQEKQIGRLNLLCNKYPATNKPSVAELMNIHGINVQPKNGLATETHAATQNVIMI